MVDVVYSCEEVDVEWTPLLEADDAVLTAVDVALSVAEAETVAPVLAETVL